MEPISLSHLLLTTFLQILTSHIKSEILNIAKMFRVTWLLHASRIALFLTSCSQDILDLSPGPCKLLWDFPAKHHCFCSFLSLECSFFSSLPKSYWPSDFSSLVTSLGKPSLKSPAKLWQPISYNSLDFSPPCRSRLFCPTALPIKRGNLFSSPTDLIWLHLPLPYHIQQWWVL